MTASTSARIAPWGDSCANTWGRSSCDWTDRRRRVSSGICCASGTTGRSSDRIRPMVTKTGRRGLEAAEISLAILSSRLTIGRSCKRRMARGTGFARLQACFAEPCPARMPFGARCMVGLAFCGRGIDGLRWGFRRSRFPRLGLGVLLVIGRFRVFRSFLLGRNDMGFRFRFLWPWLRPCLRRDFVAATLEDLQGDLELLRFERSQVELSREVDEVPFFLRQVHRLADEIVIVPIRRRLERCVPHPVDVSPDCPRLLQVHVGQDRAHVGEAQGFQGPLVLDMLEYRSTNRLILPELVRLPAVRSEGCGLVHVLDHLVQGLERHRTVTEHFVPRRGPGEMLLKPDHGLGEIFDLRDVKAFLRGGPSALSRLKGRVEGKRRVEALECVIEPLQSEERETLAGPRGLVPRVESQGTVVRLHGRVKPACAIFRDSAGVPQTLVVWPNFGRMGERLGGGGELCQVQRQQALAWPRLAGSWRSLDGRVEP